jgi:hypothetical protein
MRWHGKAQKMTPVFYLRHIHPPRLHSDLGLGHHVLNLWECVGNPNRYPEKERTMEE